MNVAFMDSSTSYTPAVSPTHATRTLCVKPIRLGKGDYHDLYWTVGDGGPQNDPDNRAQDHSEYHGSIIRIAVPSYVPDAFDEDTGYEIPAGNAFDGSDGKAWGFLVLVGARGDGGGVVRVGGGWC